MKFFQVKFITPKIEKTIFPKGAPHVTSNMEWECKEAVDVKDTVIIPVHNKLTPLLEENKLMKTRFEEVPTYVT